MSGRRTLIERVVVAAVSATIAVVFVVATKPWNAHLPREHRPARSTVSSP